VIAFLKKSIFMLKAVPEEFVTEEMLFYVAEVAPGCLKDNFPEQYRNKSFVAKLIERYPNAAWCIEHYKLGGE
jgi:hypothetical protein